MNNARMIKKIGDRRIKHQELLPQGYLTIILFHCLNPTLKQASGERQKVAQDLETHFQYSYITNMQVITNLHFVTLRL